MPSQFYRFIEVFQHMRNRLQQTSWTSSKTKRHHYVISYVFIPRKIITRVKGLILRISKVCTFPFQNPYSPIAASRVDDTEGSFIPHQHDRRRRTTIRVHCSTGWRRKKRQFDGEDPAMRKGNDDRRRGWWQQLSDLERTILAWLWLKSRTYSSGNFNK